MTQDKEKLKESTRRSNRKKMQRNQELVRCVKSQPCADCGVE